MAEAKSAPKDVESGKGKGLSHWYAICFPSQALTQLKYNQAHGH
jgi:hypothetical protein